MNVNVPNIDIYIYNYLDPLWSSKNASIVLNIPAYKILLIILNEVMNISILQWCVFVYSITCRYNASISKFKCLRKLRNFAKKCLKSEDSHAFEVVFLGFESNVGNFFYMDYGFILESFYSSWFLLRPAAVIYDFLEKGMLEAERITQQQNILVFNWLPIDGLNSNLLHFLLITDILFSISMLLIVLYLKPVKP
ncbi:hypothetical protein AGLY_001742 [Aphis glycines]|uniref:Uncharacterized protein n=1 Tax=Aphis glycines TaxID=307491 RepID=A0A6G0U534_APHGL|nr:hypothetical protein AGLY_001742 [Aphis glycines]